MSAATVAVVIDGHQDLSQAVEQYKPLHFPKPIPMSRQVSGNSAPTSYTTECGSGCHRVDTSYRLAVTLNMAGGGESVQPHLNPASVSANRAEDSLC
jgi:hypothetical protein